MLRIVCKRRTACRPNACCSESLFTYAPTLRLFFESIVCRIGEFECIAVVSNRNSVWERINIAVFLNGDIVWRHRKRQNISKTIKAFTFRKSAYCQLTYALMLRIVYERRTACRPNACCGESLLSNFPIFCYTWKRIICGFVKWNWNAVCTNRNSTANRKDVSCPWNHATCAAWRRIEIQFRAGNKIIHVFRARKPFQCCSPNTLMLRIVYVWATSIGINKIYGKSFFGYC